MYRLHFKLMVIHIQMGQSLERGSRVVAKCVCVCVKYRDVSNCRCWRSCQWKGREPEDTKKKINVD